MTLPRVQIAEEREVVGTAYRAVIRCGYDELVANFGVADLSGSIDSKITCEWQLVLITEDFRRIPFTVYNWKDKTPPQENSMWHVGSFGTDDAILFDFLEKELRFEVIAK